MRKIGSKKFSVGFFLYNNKKKILLHKRDDKSYIASPNKWDYFGGNGKKDEIIKEAVQRELDEELGITTKTNKIKPLCDYYEGKTHKYMFYIFSTHKTREFRLGEGAGFAWFSFNEVFKLNLTESARKNLLILKKKIKKN